MSRIVLTGGGTAGHCIPNVALISQLKNYFDEIYYIGSYDGIEKEIVKKTNIDYFPVTVCKLVRSSFIKNLSLPYKLPKGISEAKKILSSLKPDVVFSKGGYVSLPVCLACKKLGIPYFVHESDLTAGLANKLSAGGAQAVLTAFPQTAKKFKNGMFVGSPVRKELFTDTTKTDFFGNKKPVLLVTGGSSGSEKINFVLGEALQNVLPVFNVIHITGKGRKPLSRDYGYKAIDFTDNMTAIFNSTDVALSRCGANSAVELTLKKIPAVYVPLPKGHSRGDQIQNAEYLYRRGLCDVLYEENLTPESLSTAVMGLYTNRFNFKRNLETQTDVKCGNDEITAVLKKYARP